MKIDIKDNKIFFSCEDRTFLNVTVDRTSKCVFIELLKVKRLYREQKCAKKIMKKALAYLKENGYDEVCLNPLPLDKDGLDLETLILFYKKFGFVESHKRDITYPYLMVKYLQ